MGLHDTRDGSHDLRRQALRHVRGAMLHIPANVVHSVSYTEEWEGIEFGLGRAD